MFASQCFLLEIHGAEERPQPAGHLHAPTSTESLCHLPQARSLHVPVQAIWQIFTTNPMLGHRVRRRTTTMCSRPEQS